VSEVTIRAFEVGDVDAVHAILQCPGVIAGTLQLPWQSVDLARERYARPDPDAHRLVGIVEGRIVGNLGLHLIQRGRRRDVASIGMAVHDDFQNRGVGTALMAYYMARLRPSS
jgi:L-phenylalanine/L-methionine N-acetyltransferase